MWHVPCYGTTTGRFGTGFHCLFDEKYGTGFHCFFNEKYGTVFNCFFYENKSCECNMCPLKYGGGGGDDGGGR